MNAPITGASSCERLGVVPLRHTGRGRDCSWKNRDKRASTHFVALLKLRGNRRLLGQRLWQLGRQSVFQIFRDFIDASIIMNNYGEIRSKFARAHQTGRPRQKATLLSYPPVRRPCFVPRLNSADQLRPEFDPLDEPGRSGMRGDFCWS
jgi:hypothetical protein